MGRLISVILPVLNEAETLAGTLQCLRRSGAGKPHEIIVVDGQSRDGSAAIARPLADQVLSLNRSGRAYQMHQGALAAQGDLLVFLHGDTQLPAGWPQSLDEAWQKEPGLSAAAFHLGFDRDGFAYKVIARLAHWRSLCTGVPLGDQVLAVTRRNYLKAGGFPDVPLMEEYYLLRRLKALGPVRILAQKVRTSARRYEQNGPWLQALRNSALTALFYLGVPPRALVRLYR